MPQPSIIASLARDLSLKLIDRRNLSTANLPQALIELAETGQEIVRASKIKGLPLLRLAGSLTLSQIDRGWLGHLQAIKERLKLNALLLEKIAQEAGPEKAKQTLQLTISVTIKLMETNGVSSSNWEEAFWAIARAFSQITN
ncbi:MAG: hypothetical protein LBT38_06005 [Deltaproteobacteria bacterium]|jgi:hypothetical protein|nr:hypothetical protein [Deltaproteobacteria bacterium]